jgi:hypothetical protein
MRHKYSPKTNIGGHRFSVALFAGFDLDLLWPLFLFFLSKKEKIKKQNPVQTAQTLPLKKV